MRRWVGGWGGGLKCDDWLLLMWAGVGPGAEPGVEPGAGPEAGTKARKKRGENPKHKKYLNTTYVRAHIKGPIPRPPPPLLPHLTSPRALLTPETPFPL